MYITVDTVREMCDWVYNPETDSMFYTPDDSIVYCKTDHLLEFRLFLDRIKPAPLKNIVLVSHGGAFPVSEEVEFIPHMNVSLNPLYFKHPSITHWFAKNCFVYSPEIEGLPCGLSESYNDHGQYEYLTKAKQNRRPSKDIFCCFDVSTNPNRVELVRQLAQLPIETYLYFGADKRPFGYEEYTFRLANHKMALVPEGVGVDSHRLWECLYLGVIPICIWHPALFRFPPMPVIWLDDWSQLAHTAGLKKACGRLQQWPKPKHLEIEYWHKKAREHLCRKQ